MIMSSINFVWGCDPSVQFETSWILSLLDTGHITHFDFFTNPLSSDLPFGSSTTVLCESGIHTLTKNILPQTVDQILISRRQRIEYLTTRFDKFILFHISDEEGKDADFFYHLLPSNVTVFRNFYHARHFGLFDNLHTFPIGPRDIFLDLTTKQLSKSSSRDFPWAFMGTLWPSGSRKIAVSTFLSYLPNGFYYGGSQFGQGLPLDQ